MQTDIVPLFRFFVTKFGKDLRQLLILIRNHILRTLWYININIWIVLIIPLKQSFFHELSAMIGNKGLWLYWYEVYCILKVNTPSRRCEEIIDDNSLKVRLLFKFIQCEWDFKTNKKLQDKSKLKYYWISQFFKGFWDFDHLAYEPFSCWLADFNTKANYKLYKFLKRNEPLGCYWF